MGKSSQKVFQKYNRPIWPCAFLCLPLLLLFGIFILCNNVVYAEESPSANSIDGPLSLAQGVKLTLTQSPYIKIQDLKIQIKGLDADDAWYQMFPKINLGLTSNTPIIEGKNSSNPSFRATLTTGSYDPITASISHEAQLKLTELAKYAKLETASNLIKNTISVYIREAMFSKRVESFNQLIKLAEQNLEFVRQNYPDAPTVPLDVRLAEQQIKRLQNQKRQQITIRTNLMMRLKRMLGFPVEQKLQLDTTDLESRLFRSFDSGKLTFEQIRSNSIKEKMAKLTLALAENNILAAWARYVPKFSFTLRSPDPVNSNTNKDDSYYLTLGMSAPIWYWGELERGRDRARLQKQQTIATTQNDWLEFEDDWYSTRSNVEQLQESKELAESEIQIQMLSVRKAEIMFNAGRMRYNDYLHTQLSLVKDKIDQINAQEAYLLARLDAFATSGELLRRFVSINDKGAANDQ